MNELDRAMARLAEGPTLCPAYLHGTRVARLRRFPFVVVFRQGEGWIDVLAVAHLKRRPGYWRRRDPG